MSQQRIYTTKQKAFTLIEVLTMMVVLVAIATITVKSVGQFSFENRYQITADRYDKIKTAILGNPNQTINGHPSVSGFVADMGRLPHCLRELIDGTNCNPDPTDAGYCSDGTSPDPDTCLATAGNLWKDKLYQIDSACSDSTYTTQNDCEINLKKWIPITGLGYGWRGSYIETTNDPNNSNAITDGWGNTAKCFDLANYPQNSTIQDTCESNGHKWFGYSNLDDIPPDFNYGWFFDNYTESGELTIKSYGKDGLLDALVTPMSNYDKDFPENPSPMIKLNEWKSTYTTVNVNFYKPDDVTVSTTPKNRADVNELLACTNYGGNWNGTTSYCTMLSEYTDLECTVANLGSGTTWNATTKCSKIKPSICLDLYYIDINSIPKRLNSSTQISNLSIQTASFLLSENLPIGQVTFRITNCGDATNPPVTYPTIGRDFKIVDILPNRSLTFDW